MTIFMLVMLVVMAVPVAALVMSILFVVAVTVMGVLAMSVVLLFAFTPITMVVMFLHGLVAAMVMIAVALCQGGRYGEGDSQARSEQPARQDFRLDRFHCASPSAASSLPERPVRISMEASALRQARRASVSCIRLSALVCSASRRSSTPKRPAR